MRLLNIASSFFMPEVIDIISKNLAKADFHFNASLAEVDGKLYMAYRANNGFQEARIFVNTLNKKTLQPAGKPKEIVLPNVTTTKHVLWEDPRLFWFNGDLYCSFVFLREGYSAQCQGLAKLSRSFEVLSTWFIPYGGNINLALKDPVRKTHPKGFVFTESPGNLFEKNWQFFEYAGDLHFVYKINNHTVVNPNLVTGEIEVEYSTEGMLPWEYGEPRGGTPPIPFGKDRLMSVFHSHLYDKKLQKKVYYAGVYTFENFPPFTPLQVSKFPILKGDTQDKTVLWNNVAVFPCGVINLGKDYLVSYGHNDYCIKLLKITHDEIEQNLINVTYGTTRDDKRTENLQPSGGVGEAEEGQERCSEVLQRRDQADQRRDQRATWGGGAIIYGRQN